MAARENDLALSIAPNFLEARVLRGALNAIRGEPANAAAELASDMANNMANKAQGKKKREMCI